METSKAEGESSPVWIDVRTLPDQGSIVDSSEEYITAFTSDTKSIDLSEDYATAFGSGTISIDLSEEYATAYTSDTKSIELSDEYLTAFCSESIMSDVSIEFDVESTDELSFESSSESSILTLKDDPEEQYRPLPNFSLMDKGFLDFLLLHMFPMNSKMKTSVSFPLSKKEKKTSRKRPKYDAIDILFRNLIPSQRSLRKRCVPNSMSESSYLWKKLQSVEVSNKRRYLSLSDLNNAQDRVWEECLNHVFPTSLNISNRVSL